jgi:hypothetical protein
LFVCFLFFENLDSLKNTPTHKEEKKGDFQRLRFNGCWRLINTDDCHVKWSVDEFHRWPKTVSLSLLYSQSLSVFFQYSSGCTHRQ